MILGLVVVVAHLLMMDTIHSVGVILRSTLVMWVLRTSLGESLWVFIIIIMMISCHFADGLTSRETVLFIDVMMEDFMMILVMATDGHRWIEENIGNILERICMVNQGHLNQVHSNGKMNGQIQKGMKIENHHTCKGHMIYHQ